MCSNWPWSYCKSLLICFTKLYWFSLFSIESITNWTKTFWLNASGSDIKSLNSWLKSHSSWSQCYKSSHWPTSSIICSLWASISSYNILVSFCIYVINSYKHRYPKTASSVYFLRKTIWVSKSFRDFLRYYSWN